MEWHTQVEGHGAHLRECLMVHIGGSVIVHTVSAVIVHIVLHMCLVDGTQWWTCVLSRINILTEC